MKNTIYFIGPGSSQPNTYNNGFPRSLETPLPGFEYDNKFLHFVGTGAALKRSPSAIGQMQTFIVILGTEKRRRCDTEGMASIACTL